MIYARRVYVPFRDCLRLKYLVLGANGTIALDLLLLPLADQGLHCERK